MLKNGQTYFKNLTVFTPQDSYSIFGHFSTLCMKGLKIYIYNSYAGKSSYNGKGNRTSQQSLNFIKILVSQIY